VFLIAAVATAAEAKSFHQKSMRATMCPDYNEAEGEMKEGFAAQISALVFAIAVITLASSTFCCACAVHGAEMHVMATRV
jgi:hypothetical protein